MVHQTTPKNSIKYLNIFFACNPISKKDSHPEVPYLNDLLKDSNRLKKVRMLDFIYD